MACNTGDCTDTAAACANSASEPIGTSSAESLVCNISTIDKVVNGQVTVNNRVGNQLLSLAQLQYLFGFGVAPFDFSTGGTLQSVNQLVLNSDGFYYHYIGDPNSIPLVIAPGFDPSASADWEAFTATVHNLLDDRNAAGAHDAIYRRAATVPEVENGDFEIGARLSLTDRTNAPFDIKASGWPQPVNGFDVLDAGSGNVAVLVIDTIINAEHFGATDADSTLALQAAANAAQNHDFTFGANSRKLATSQIIFPNTVNIIGGRLKNSPSVGNASKPAIWLQADGSSIGTSGFVDIEGEDIAGTWPVLAFSNSGVRVGPETPGENSFLFGITIGDNLKISQMKGEGILIYHCRNSSIGSPEIKMCGYAGIIAKSVIDSSIDSPKIEGIHDEGAWGNHYGITLTRDTNNDLVNFPPSTNIQVNQPIIKNVVNWIGFDTHAGVNITTNWVRCYSCALGFNIQYDDETIGVNAPRNIKLRGYASGRAAVSETFTGLTILGTGTSRAKNIELDLVLEDYGTDTDQQRAAVTMGVCDNVKGKVILRDAKGNGLYTSGICSDVDLNLDIYGVTKVSGSSYYVRLDPVNLSNFKLSGSWGDAFGAPGDTADIGIFYSAAQGSYGDVTIDADIDVPSVYLSDGVSNKWQDLTWATPEQRKFNRVILAGGSPSEVFQVDFPRSFRGNWSSTTLRNDLTTMATIDATAHPMLTARVTGILSTSSVNVTLITLDGSNILGGGYAVSFNTSVAGIALGD